ncbi:fimbrillin family protein [Bacteroides congonensis]|uniref:fimbrillin family protein n=1 Tax=Bacteroides congonensis TaxID=1871006 RepID=UPI00189DE7C3|nr:fimbrillin family protein [Bacteroides congonensis]
MKQKLFLAAMAAIAMTSCSNDETLEINTGTEQAIDFRTAMATRATETTIDNLSSFYVTAFNENIIEAPYFENLEFTKDGDSSIFTSEDKYYYPGDGTDLTFYAYAPSVEKLGTGSRIATDNENKNLTLADFSPAVEIADQVDFITAYATGNKSDAETGVHLAFEHRLSQIEIQAIQQSNKVYNFQIKGVRIAQTVSKGGFDFKNEEWTLSTTDKAKYELEFDQAIPMTEQTILMDECGGAMLIPQELTAWDVANDKENTSKGAYISLLLRITTKDGALVYPFKEDAEAGKEYAWAAIPVDTKWEAGKKYVYRLNFANGAGYVDPEEDTNKGEQILDGEVKFDVEVTDWESHEYTGNMENGEITEDLDETDTEDPWGGE